MTGYIDRKRLKEAFNADLQYMQTVDEHAITLILTEIDEAPAADVAPVVHGMWEWFDEEQGTPIDGWERDWGWRCSTCKDTLNDEYDDPDNPPKHNYCPKCGAKMDGGGKHHDRIFNESNRREAAGT